MKMLKAFIATFFAALTLIALPASAHTVLISANPAANTTIDALPSTISLTFAEELISIGGSNSISVLDSSGTEITTGSPEVAGAILSIKLNSSEVTGLIKVKYRAVAADGHVINGEYEFTVSEKNISAADQNTPTLFSETSGNENKISIYLIISATLVVGGGLILIFIWKRQSK
jgi:methionine-rich copper-binding protein CopC